MKKKLFLSVICMMLVSLGLAASGCSSAETYDAGNISCAVPEGWKVLSDADAAAEASDDADAAADTSDDADVSDEDKNASEEEAAKDEAKDNEESDADPNSISIYKGAESASDMLTTNGINILYSEYGLMGTFDDMKGFYEKPKDQKPIKLGSYEWEWFTGAQANGKYEYAIMAAEDGNAAIQVSVILKNGKNTISMDDSDVKEILESIKITGSGDSE